MKLTLIQMETLPGDIQGNLARIGRQLKSTCEGAECCIFPAESLTGIPKSVDAVEDASQLVEEQAARRELYRLVGRDEKTLRFASTGALPCGLRWRVNCVGARHENRSIIPMPGLSRIENAAGKPVALLKKPFEEGVLFYDTESLHQPIPLPRLGGPTYWLAAIRSAFRFFDALRGPIDFPWLIGVSGGIDSAVVLCLLEQAVGRDRIKALTLPSRYSSDATRHAARQLCERLGVPLTTISIEPLVEAVRHSLESAGIMPSAFHEENIQAKVRGTDLLSNAAGVLGGLATCNGNLVEATLGYATLYGDTNGALAPLGGLTKLEVWELARYLNREIYGEETIPDALIPETPTVDARLRPSAELNVAQVDPMKWGYHDALTTALGRSQYTVQGILGAWKKGRLAELVAQETGMHVSDAARILERHALDDRNVFLDDLAWFLRLRDLAAFKRKQLPPIVRLHPGHTANDPQRIAAWSRERLESLLDDSLQETFFREESASNREERFPS